MRRMFVSSVLIGTLAATTAFAADKPGDTARGKQLYMATGCYQCHGTRGEGGGNSGPRLAPGPMPYEGLLLQLRKPRARMPVYTAVVMPDKDVADIYAYLASVPKGKTASEIPMLKALSNQARLIPSGIGDRTAPAPAGPAGRSSAPNPGRF